MLLRSPNHADFTLRECIPYVYVHLFILHTYLYKIIMHMYRASP